MNKNEAPTTLGFKFIQGNDCQYLLQSGQNTREDNTSTTIEDGALQSYQRPYESFVVVQNPGVDSFENKAVDVANTIESSGHMPTFPKLDSMEIGATYHWNERSPTSNQLQAVHDVALDRLTTLNKLHDEGFIDLDEYERRKSFILEEVTHQGIMPNKKSLRWNNACPTVVPEPPEFSKILPEDCIKHVFDYETRQWSAKKIRVKLSDKPFAKGSLRLVYHLEIINVDSTENFVAKLAIDPDEDPQTYFRDIELQEHCAYYAKLYNEYNPPKYVEFVKAWVLELIERDGALCGVERFISGSYRKHNNNFGSVSDGERNTPQAFSHFTYEASNHEFLAVDIQGVGDLYTDPQIHTQNGNDFGKGNLGVLGFHKFIQTHQCNSVCRYLKLAPINPKEENNDYGTVAVPKFMMIDSIRSVRFESKHYFEHAPLLKKYLSQYKQEDSRQSCRFCGIHCSVM